MNTNVYYIYIYIYTYVYKYIYIYIYIYLLKKIIYLYKNEHKIGIVQLLIVKNDSSELKGIL